MVTGDDFGQIKLFKWPCWKDRAQFNAYIGHSSHVTEVKFTKGDKRVVSVGGQDKTLIVWEVIGGG
jgi:WD40 repeat protein